MADKISLLASFMYVLWQEVKVLEYALKKTFYRDCNANSKNEEKIGSSELVFEIMNLEYDHPDKFSKRFFQTC